MSTALVVCDDLIFTSKVTATARAAGVAATAVKSADRAVAAAEAHPPGCVILDLHTPGLDVAAFVAAVRSAAPGVRVVAFGSHVDAEALKAARKAGCDRVMPRSQFVAELEPGLPAWARGDASL